MQRLALPVFAALLLYGCGGNPFAPPAVASLAGSWSGTVRTSAGTLPITAAFTQTNGDVTGTWASGSTVHGNVAVQITPDNTVTGSFQWLIPVSNAQECFGGSSVSGTLNGNTLTLTAPSVEFTAPPPLGFAGGEVAHCLPLASVSWTLTR